MEGVEISECCSETEFLYKRALRGKSGIIDRSLLTRKQHENLLAQPRPIPKSPPPPKRKVKQCAIPKICSPRIDQLAIPTQKLIEGVLQNFNKTLEAERVVRLVKLAHSNRNERPHYTHRKCKKKKKKPKKNKKENCLKVWLNRRVRRSAKLIMVQIRKRRELLPNYRQLLVSMGIFKLLKLKKKRNKCMCKYTRQYLMKICEQLAIVCDTEFPPYKKPPPMERLPPSEVESVESKKHIYWKMREVPEEKRSVTPEEEEGEEEECIIEVEEEAEMWETDEDRGGETKEEEGRGEGEMEEGPSFPPIKEEPPELGEGDTTEPEESEGEFLPDVDTEDTGREPETEGEEVIPEESEGGVTDGEGGAEEAGDEDEGEAEEQGGAVGEVPPEEPGGEVEEPGVEEEEPGGEEEEEPGGEAEEPGGGAEEIPTEPGMEEGKEVGPEGEETVGEEEGMGEGEEEIEPKPPSEKPSEEKPPSEKPPSEVPSEGKPPSEVPSEGKPPSEVPSEGKPPSEAPSEGKPPSEVPSEGKPPSEAPPTEGKPPSEKPSEALVDAHPPDTVSYLTCQVYASWLDEFAANIQIYSKCLRNFREMLEARYVPHSDKITQVLNNWGTYLRDSWEFEKNMSEYLKGKPVTRCSKCGEYNLHNLPPDHEIPPELKVAVDSTVRWRELLEEAERLCTMYTTPHEDTVSLASHETIHIVDATLQSSETSMYIFEDFINKCPTDCRKHCGK